MVLLVALNMSEPPELIAKSDCWLPNRRPSGISACQEVGWGPRGHRRPYVECSTPPTGWLWCNGYRDQIQPIWPTIERSGSEGPSSTETWSPLRVRPRCGA